MKASYWSQDMCKMLGLTSSTFRRWSGELEKKGWKFEKDENGRRRFHDRDVVAFRSIMDMNERQNIKIEEAISTVAATYYAEPNISSQEKHNMDVERSKNSDQLALSIQTMRSEFEQGFVSVAQEVGELRKAVEAMQKELAATREENRLLLEEKKKSWWKLW